jgi:hypothetical protein
MRVEIQWEQGMLNCNVLVTRAIPPRGLELLRQQCCRV